MTNKNLRDKAVEAVIKAGAEMLDCKPEDLHVHISRETTQEDWDKADPNSWGGTCKKCGNYIVGQFAPKGQDTIFKCDEPNCDGEPNGIESPAYASSLVMHDPNYW